MKPQKRDNLAFAYKIVSAPVLHIIWLVLNCTYLISSTYFASHCALPPKPIHWQRALVIGTSGRAMWEMIPPVTFFDVSVFKTYIYMYKGLILPPGNLCSLRHCVFVLRHLHPYNHLNSLYCTSYDLLCPASL